MKPLFHGVQLLGGGACRPGEISGRDTAKGGISTHRHLHFEREGARVESDKNDHAHHSWATASFPGFKVADGNDLEGALLAVLLRRPALRNPKVTAPSLAQLVQSHWQSPAGRPI